MTNPMDRAVEAGARAAIRDETFPHDVAGMVTARSLTKAIIGAAFPILAEELDLDLALAEQFARTGDTTRLVAALGDARARIQQMAEAERWLGR